MQNNPPSVPASPPFAGKSRIVARNSVWYGLEVLLEAAAAVAVSIVIARVIGPQKLAYFQYVLWLVNASSGLGALGLPVTAKKYVAEYLGRGELGLVRQIVKRLLRLQFLTALAITGGGLVVVWLFGDPTQRVISYFLVASMLPHILRGIPAQVNMARERMDLNVPASVVGNALYILFVTISLWSGWDLKGIAIGTLFHRSADLGLKYLAVHRWLRTLPDGEELPPEMIQRMRTFSRQGMAFMLLRLIVWDRSDMIFLKWLNSDLRQITFFGLALNLTDRAFQLPQVFAAAGGVSAMNEYGHQMDRFRLVSKHMTRYLLLSALPLFFGMAVMSPPLIRLIYGAAYVPAIPVVALAALIAIPKIFSIVAQQFLEAAELQSVMVRWGIIGAVINAGLDLCLVGPYGAVGAVIASGVAQTVYVTFVWMKMQKELRLDLSWMDFAKPMTCTLAMCGSAWLASWNHGSVAALLLGIPAGALTFLLMLRITRCLTGEDQRRFAGVFKGLPRPIRQPSLFILNAVVAGQSTP